MEFCLDGFHLLVDPFFTRPPSWKLLSPGGVPSDSALVARYISRADAVLVSHSHYDHILDVPNIMRATGAPAFGSANTADLLKIHGLPDHQINQVSARDSLQLGPFQVEVFPARHTRTPLDRWINRRLPLRIKQSQLPLRLVDYPMDECFSFRIWAGGGAVLVGNHPVKADILFISPFHSLTDLEKILRGVRPRLVVPVHWDDFTRPLSLPLRTMPVTRAQGWGGWPPVRRLDLKQFSGRVQQIEPEIRVLQPQIFKEESYGPNQNSR